MGNYGKYSHPRAHIDYDTRIRPEADWNPSIQAAYQSAPLQGDTEYREDSGAMSLHDVARGNLLSGTTDNGCKFPDQGPPGRVLGCMVYYTHAHASYEKGGVENGNRLFRRWFPKGTDFAEVTQSQMEEVLAIISNMPRKSLKAPPP